MFAVVTSAREREEGRKRREQIFQIRFVAKCVKAFSISVRAVVGGDKESRVLRFLWLSNAMEFVFTRSKLAEPKLNLIQKNTDEFPARVLYLSLCLFPSVHFPRCNFQFTFFPLHSFAFSHFVFCCCLLCFISCCRRCCSSTGNYTQSISAPRTVNKL